MQVHGQNPVCTSGGNQVGHQFRRNRCSGPRFPVLTRISEIGDNTGNAACRGPAQGIDADQQFHQVIVGRIRSRLDDENVFTTHIFLYLDKDFHIGKPSDAGFCERDIETGGNSFGERPITVSGEHFHAEFLVARKNKPNSLPGGSVHGPTDQGPIINFARNLTGVWQPVNEEGQRISE